MRFAPIDYLNLLKMNVYFAKKGIKTLKNKAAEPSKVNEMFKKRRIDAAFISSLIAKDYKRAMLGICANKEVRSVLLISGEQIDDPASATSNMLVRVLKLKGQTIIGDKALRDYHNGLQAKDLAKAWHKKYNLPFVFAVLGVRKNSELFMRLAKKMPKKIFISNYILKKEAQKRNIDYKHAKQYLELIEHKIDAKKYFALKRFWRGARLIK